MKELRSELKRRNHDINPESPVPTSFPAALHRAQSAVTRPDSRSNRDYINHGFVADGPKTSEYAFFKKLKNDAGQRFDSPSIQRKKNQPNKLNSSECPNVVEGTKIVRNISKSSEGTNINTNCSKDFRSPLSVRNVSSKELQSLLPIEDVSSKDSGSTLPVNNTYINFDSFLSPDYGAASNWCMQGSQSDQAELFSRKRRKLRQWAYNSYPEMGELCSKGYDLISMILSRLLPWSNEKNSFISGESAAAESKTKTESLACSKADIPSKKLYRMPTRNIMEVEYMPYLENGASYCWSDRSRETMLPNICSPTCNNHITHQKNSELPSSEVTGRNLISCIESDSIFSFPFVRRGSFPPFSPVKGLDDFHDPNDSLPGREPHPLLLEWDSLNMNERSLSPTGQNTNWTIIPAVQSSWDHQKILNNLSESYGISGLCSSPVLGNYPQDFYTIMPHTSTSCEKQKLGRFILEEEEETAADLNPLPLTLSHSSKYPNLMGDCNYNETACKGSETGDILSSLGNHLGLISKAFGEENSTSGTETHLSFVLDVEWKCLQSSGLVRDLFSSTYNDHQFPEKEIICSTFLSEDEFGSSSDGSSYSSFIHSSEDMLGIHDGRSFYLPISEDKDKAYPL